MVHIPDTTRGHPRRPSKWNQRIEYTPMNDLDGLNLAFYIVLAYIHMLSSAPLPRQYCRGKQSQKHVSRRKQTTYAKEKRLLFCHIVPSTTQYSHYSGPTKRHHPTARLSAIMSNSLTRKFVLVLPSGPRLDKFYIIDSNRASLFRLRNESYAVPLLLLHDPKPQARVERTNF